MEVHSLALLTRHPERNEQKSRPRGSMSCSCGRHPRGLVEQGFGTMPGSHWARNSTSTVRSPAN